MCYDSMQKKKQNHPLKIQNLNTNLTPLQTSLPASLPEMLVGPVQA
jgi:hypothetical protein